MRFYPKSPDGELLVTTVVISSKPVAIPRDVGNNVIVTSLNYE